MNPEAVASILASAPGSIELPAGCGKTELIVRLAKAKADSGKRTLLLTHTHAGVDALRRRCRRLGVPSSAVWIRTIDSWAFDLIRSFPQLAEVSARDEPDWAESEIYHRGAARASSAEAVARMLRVSYSLVLVDEYQDCSIEQHRLAMAIAEFVPTLVFGDRAQGLLWFAKPRPVDWEGDVIPAFPAIDVEFVPRRWLGTNPLLGAWTIEARRQLLAGHSIDLRSAPVQRESADRFVAVCRSQPPHPARTVILARMEHDCAALAPRVQGGYSMIEELEGKHLLAFADRLATATPGERAAALLDFAVSCGTGIADVFNSDSRKRLRQGKSLTAPRFSSYVEQRDAINALLTNEQTSAFIAALDSLRALPGFRLHRREAWQGVGDALKLVQATPDLSLRQAIVKTRQHLRRVGRFPESRIIARPLLVKGLEFDHAVLIGPETYDAHTLYVALTRGAKNVTVLTDRPVLSPSRPALGPGASPSAGWMRDPPSYSF